MGRGITPNCVPSRKRGTALQGTALALHGCPAQLHEPQLYSSAHEHPGQLCLAREVLQAGDSSGTSARIGVMPLQSDRGRG